MLPIFITFVFMAHIRTSASHRSKKDNVWPEGTYGLPKAKTGCPKTDQFAWDQGWRLQTMDNDWSKRETTEFSNSIHMEVSLARQFLTRTFCIKREPEKSTLKRMWPKGSYCIYQYEKCPAGMVNGYIKWNDESRDNVNQHLGSLPAGIYQQGVTVIFYCCQNQSSWYDVIELPITSPFFLLPYKPRYQAITKCQRVKWAIATMEYIRYDTDDNHGENIFHNHHVATDQTIRSWPKVYYCYYKSCRHKMNESMAGIFYSFGDKTQSLGQNTFPTTYPSYQSCSWLITVNDSSIVSLNFTSLYISDCKENFLKIYDGTSEASSTLGTHCGFSTPRDVKVLSTGRSIFLVLKSGNLSQNTNYSFGFKAQYGYSKIVPTPSRTPHNVAAIGLTFFALLFIFVLVSVFIGYQKRSKTDVKEKEPTSRFHVPSTILMETSKLSEFERAPSHKETSNPYYVTARLWDDSSLSRSSDNVAYVTSPELNHGYMDASGSDHVV